MNTVSVRIAVIRAATCRQFLLAELRAHELINCLFSFFPQTVEFVFMTPADNSKSWSCVSPFPASERVPILKLLQNTGVFWRPSFSPSPAHSSTTTEAALLPIHLSTSS